MTAAVASSSTGRRNDSTFLSVFPRTTFTTPTPESTPNIGVNLSPGQPFGGFDLPTNATDGVARFNRAWSTATRYLSLPPSFSGRNTAPIADILQAFSLLLESQSTQKDLIVWYANEVSIHFRNFVLPELHDWQQPIPISKAPEVLQFTARLLQKAQNHYLGHLDALETSAKPHVLQHHVQAFSSQTKRNWHTLVLHALPQQRLQVTLASVMYQQMQSSLQHGSNPEKCLKGDQCYCHVDLAGLPLQQFCKVGFGGLVGERAFAHAVHRFLQGPAIERRCFEVDWHGQSSVVPKLRSWISKQLVPMVEHTLAALTGHSTFELPHNDAQQFASMAVANLGRLRTLSIFDYIKTWPTSRGAILDIWEYLNAGGQAEKVSVCQSFSDQIQRRLLHAGASTSDILSIYVNVIHAFKSLDSRGVLLEKVAGPMRTFLHARSDTVTNIAASFLADIGQDGNVVATDMETICPDITIEVAKSTLEDSRDHKMLNWDDMEWMPDPIDAGPDHKSSKSKDVVTYVLGLFEQEEFLKEVTTVLAQHLLHAADSEYIKETRLVELLKSRLDATKLQPAEVMLKDMRDSATLGKRINPSAYGSKAAVPTPREIQAAIPDEGITPQSLFQLFESRMTRPQFIAAVKMVATKRDDLFFAKRTRIPPDPTGSASKKKDTANFKAHILSSFFWPQLRSNEFTMPSTLEPLRDEFVQRFGMLGSQRKLQFRPALARVSMRLELEDRTVEETDVSGWRASVIDAFNFQPEAIGDGEYDPEIGLTAKQLMDVLKMEEELVLDALNFWINKRVLYRTSSGAYAVLERLDLDVGMVQQQTQHEDTISAVRSQNAMLQENVPVFETFIASMLKNTGAKEVEGDFGIAKLLKMMCPVFTYGEEEVKWLMAEMEKKGMVKSNGGSWSIV